MMVQLYFPKTRTIEYPREIASVSAGTLPKRISPSSSQLSRVESSQKSDANKLRSKLAKHDVLGTNSSRNSQADAEAEDQRKSESKQAESEFSGAILE